MLNLIQRGFHYDLIKAVIGNYLSFTMVLKFIRVSIFPLGHLELLFFKQFGF